MPRDQTVDRVINAIDSWILRGEEPWHLEPPDTEAEDRKERDWSYLEGEARQFVEKYGAAAMLRCISEALK